MRADRPNDAERQAQLSQIASFSKRDPLTDEEFEFLETNFEWDSNFLEQIRITRKRPFNDFLDGFIEKCSICEVPRNYCCD